MKILLLTWTFFHFKLMVVGHLGDNGTHVLKHVGLVVKLVKEFATILFQRMVVANAQDQAVIPVTAINSLVQVNLVVYIYCNDNDRDNDNDEIVMTMIRRVTIIMKNIIIIIAIFMTIATVIIL